MLPTKPFLSLFARPPAPGLPPLSYDNGMHRYALREPYAELQFRQICKIRKAVELIPGSPEQRNLWVYERSRTAWYVLTPICSITLRRYVYAFWS